jgi:cytoskeletal protein CcmA (bactofilin family)
MFGKSNDQLPPAAQLPQSPAGTKTAETPPATKPAEPAPATKAAEPTPAEPISTIGRSMTVVGKIVDKGKIQLLGQLEGELRAVSILIEEGAKVEGDLIAEELTIGGTVKGTIRANRVRLNSTAVVEGDIFHRSLSIEENARFEGLSKRQDKAAEALPAAVEHPTTHEDVQTTATAIQGCWKSNGAASHDDSASIGAS